MAAVMENDIVKTKSADATTGRQAVDPEKNPSSQPLAVAEENEEEYPEGGKDAWLVVFGAWCAMIPSMGWLNTVGVLQAWVQEHQLKEYSEFDIGWIFGLFGFFLYLAGAQVG